MEMGMGGGGWLVGWGWGGWGVSKIPVGEGVRAGGALADSSASLTQPIRVAVVGVGYLGRVHAKIYAGMEGVELVAVADCDAGRAGEVAGEYGCAGVGGVEEVVEMGGVDAVSVVVPTSLHLPVTRAVVEGGMHAMLEKPLAPSVAESEEIVRLAREAGVILQVGHLERFNAGVMKLAEVAGEPRFIEVHRLGTFVERATDVDVVADLMIHDIDIVLSLVAAEITKVAATGARVLSEHVDIASARLEFANGAVANVTASRVSRKPLRRIRVFSKEAYLGLNFISQELEMVFPRKCDAGGRFPRLVEERVEVVPQLPLDAELAHFVECVRTGGTPLVTGEAGLRAVQVAEEVRERIAGAVEAATVR